MHLKEMIESGDILATERKPLIREVEAIYDMKLHEEYFLKILPAFLSEIKISRLISGYKKGTPQEFASKISKALEESKPSSSKSVSIKPLIDCQMSDVPVEYVPCGINAIDSRMNGGLGKGEFGVVCGVSGLGKTTVGINFCWGACLSHKKTLLITLELPQKKISERLYSRMTQVDYNRIRYGDDGDMDKVRDEVHQIRDTFPLEVRANFDIWDYSEEACSLKMIENRLAGLSPEEMPDMIFLDWLDALETDPSDRSNGYVSRELRHQLQNYSKGCSDIAKRFNVAFWTATQANAKGDGQREVRMSNAAEGFSKSWRCSVFLGIGATDQDREGGRMTVKAGKMRDGQIFESQILARLDKQTFEDIPPDLLNAVPSAANFTPVNRRTQNTR